MPIDTTKVVVGVASIFTAPANTVMPTDTTSVGVDWSAPWVNVGATEEGVKVLHGTTTSDLRVEEQSTPVSTLLNERNFRLQLALSEDTVENMKLAYGGGTIVTQAAATGVIGKKTFTLNETLDVLAVGFESNNPFGFFRRVYIPRVLSVADITTEYRRAANNRSYAVELHAICPPSQIVVVEKTAAALP